MNLKKLDIDRSYQEFVLYRTDKFMNIHPTAITLFGICLNFVLLYCLFYAPLWVTYIVLFFRYSADVFDGAVARLYNKVTNIGGALDTTSDNILICILGFWFTGYWVVGALLAGANLAYMYAKSSLVHHIDMKKGGNKLEDVYAFFVNNTCLSYLIVCIALGVV
jgi:phosphatidylglycerophosphate synthase